MMSIKFLVLLSVSLAIMATDVSCSDESSSTEVKAKPSVPNREEHLLNAIRRGDLGAVKEAAKGMDLKKVTNLSVHVLGCSNPEVIEYFRDEGVVHPSDLQMAAVRGDANAVRKLLTPLDKMIREQAMANGYRPPFFSDSPLTLAIRCGRPEVVRELISFGANINEQGFYSLTPLAIAAERGQVDIIQALLDAGARINSESDGYTALMRACIGKSHKATKLLLEAGADPKLSRHDGQTALHFAAKANSAACVRVLLKHGADINAITDGDKSTALEFATLYKYEEVVTVLHEFGAK